MSSRDKSLLALVVLVIIAVGGYFLVVQPEHSKANHLQTQIASQQLALTQAVNTVRAGEAAEAQYKSYGRQLKSILAAVPADEQIPQLINELQAASTKTKVSFQAVSVGSSSTAAPTAPTTVGDATAITFPVQAFTLQLDGSYFAVANLLGKLASFVRADDEHFRASGRLLSISTVGMTPDAAVAGTTSGGTGQVTATITALDYDVPSAAGSPPATTTG